MNEGTVHERIDATTYYGQTTIHPIGLAFLLLMVTAILLLPRKYAVWPAIFLSCFIAPAQRIVLFGMNFPFMRILLISAMARILLRRELSGTRFQTIDYVMVYYTLVYSLMYTIQFQSTKAFIYICSVNIDSLATFFLFRVLVRSFDDLSSMTLGFVFASVPVALAFFVEFSTHRNVFSFLGGVPLIAEMREGKLRCQGAFSHPILGGCYWALIIPLVGARWFDPRQSKLVTLIGVGCCLTCVILSSSSTPLMAVIFVIVGACFYPLRRQMKAVRRVILVTLLLLHFVFMKGPVWSLITKMNIFGGSTGWHRQHLIDKAIAFFGEWWLCGTPDTEHWGWGLHDVTNQFILEGVRGGVFTMLLFIAMIVLTFSNVGRTMRSRVVTRDRPESILTWSLGIMLFVHVMNFLAVSYFGQITTLTWLTIGASASICDAAIDLDRRERFSKMTRM